MIIWMRGSVLEGAEVIRKIFCIICSILCFCYCLLVYSIKSGTRFYMVWGATGVLFIAAALFLHFHLWTRLPFSVQILAAGCIVVCILSFVIVEGCIISQYHAKAEPQLDYIIVLGAQIKEKGPSAVLKFRLDTAYDYLINNDNTVCIVSGGQGINEPFSEAHGMKEYLEKKGIASQRILIEDKSSNTVENIIFSSAFLDKENDRVGIVTNNFHVFRGVNIAKHQGIKNVCGIAACSNVYLQPNNMFREFFGIAKDFLCGNL